MSRTSGLIAALGALIALLASCDPAPVPDARNTVWIGVAIDPEGGGTAKVSVAPVRSGGPGDVAREIASEVFPDDQPSIGIDENEPGYPIAEIVSTDLYEPGPRPALSILSEGLLPRLRELGLTTVRLSVCAPHVEHRIEIRPPSDVTEEGCLDWLVPPDEIPVAVRITMFPHVRTWLFATGFAVVSLIAFALSLPAFARRRMRGWARLAVMSGISLIAGAVAIANEVIASGDNLGVAGVLSGPALVAATAAPAIVLPVFLGAIGLFAIAVTDGNRRRRRS